LGREREFAGIRTGRLHARSQKTGGRSRSKCSKKREENHGKKDCRGEKPGAWITSEFLSRRDCKGEVFSGMKPAFIKKEENSQPLSKKRGKKVKVFLKIITIGGEDGLRKIGEVKEGGIIKRNIKIGVNKTVKGPV